MIFDNPIEVKEKQNFHFTKIKSKCSNVFIIEVINLYSKISSTNLDNNIFFKIITLKDKKTKYESHLRPTDQNLWERSLINDFIFNS